MRRDRRPPPAPGFRTSDWMRILSMLTMLVVLYMLWDRARDPATWRWLAGEPGGAGVMQVEPEVAHQFTAPAKKEAEPAASGPTDEDPEEREAIAEEFQAITDRTLAIQPEEMFAYRRILQWVVNQPVSVLRKRARTDLLFNDFMLSPDKHRGTLVELVLDAAMVRECDMRASDGSDLYEIWGRTTDSGAWLYDVVVVGLPEGFPVGIRIQERVRFVGYFFKLQGYHEGGAKPHAPPLAAPMFIGRLVWIQPPAPAKTTVDASWSSVLLVGFTVLVLAQLGWMVLKPRRRKSTTTVLSKSKPGALTMDEWLTRAESGMAPIEAEPEPETGQHGTPDRGAERNGNGQGASELFPDRLDGDAQSGG